MIGHTKFDIILLKLQVPTENDKLNHVYKAAFIKIWNIVEDSGWPLKFENQGTLQEMVCSLRSSTVSNISDSFTYSLVIEEIDGCLIRCM